MDVESKIKSHKNKFRAFYKGEMWNVTRMEWDKKGIINNIILNSNGHNEYWSLCSYDAIEIMQCAGIIDKNGVDIYEKDIVCFNDNFVCEVRFLGGVFYGANGKALNMWYTREVIGNIYENQEIDRE